MKLPLAWRAAPKSSTRRQRHNVKFETDSYMSRHWNLPHGPVGKCRVCLDYYEWASSSGYAAIVFAGLRGKVDPVRVAWAQQKLREFDWDGYKKLEKLGTPSPVVAKRS